MWDIISQCTKGVYTIQNFEYTLSMYGWYSKAVHKICIPCSKFWKQRLWQCIDHIQNLSLYWNHIMIMYIWFQILNTLRINMGDFRKCLQIMIITYCSKIWLDFRVCVADIQIFSQSVHMLNRQHFKYTLSMYWWCLKSYKIR